MGEGSDHCTWRDPFNTMLLVSSGTKNIVRASYPSGRRTLDRVEGRDIGNKVPCSKKQLHYTYVLSNDNPDIYNIRQELLKKT